MTEKKTYLYSISTGFIHYRETVKILKEQDGMQGWHSDKEKGILWLFDSLNNAKIARNVLRDNGIAVGDNIGMFVVHANNTLVFEKFAD